ncbi:MAG: hypothetical protein HRU10_14120 [Opitutales bacterium]|nr:hypothetical protein [Opitutales bacterium]
MRGARFWCSSRRKSRSGCGRSFTVYLANIIPRYSVLARTLSTLFSTWSRSSGGGQVLSAWEQAHQAGFSTDSAYRWICRLTGAQTQSAVRTQLCRARPPPPPPPPHSNGILSDLFDHIDQVCGSTHFIESFQLRFQKPWPMQA